MKQPIIPDPSNSPHFCLFPFSCNDNVSPRSSMDFETAKKRKKRRPCFLTSYNFPTVIPWLKHNPEGVITLYDAATGLMEKMSIALREILQNLESSKGRL